ncbi:hypothetical protein [Aureivirga sp. CE67]|uniref:hypothetical protein n=1 Tax=Aureivirga sp. CE67 TaxID=1788983 RepID=UPI0018C8DAE0|nr:hypothetical protein [Aureivirga sp. CE67]
MSEKEKVLFEFKSEQKLSLKRRIFERMLVPLIIFLFGIAKNSLILFVIAIVLFIGLMLLAIYSKNKNYIDELIITERKVLIKFQDLFKQKELELSRSDVNSKLYVEGLRSVSHSLELSFEKDSKTKIKQHQIFDWSSEKLVEVDNLLKVKN